jgi:DNA-binding CsgD family transcriptional regulator/tetratricopeptide (TPR) repeat protein
MGNSGQAIEPFTPREQDILGHLIHGLSNSQIAERLVLSPATIRWYVKQIYRKLDVHNREQAIASARTRGWAKQVETVVAGKPTSDVTFINPLPQDVSTRYVGYEEKNTKLIELLNQRAKLISIHGRAGSGKTALACKALAELKNNRELNGIVCLSPTGTGITLERILLDLGRLLPDADQAVMGSVVRSSELDSAQKINILLEKISTKQIILLLDNLETLQDPLSGTLMDADLEMFIEKMLKQSSAISLLITSREPLLLPRALKTWEHIISLEEGLSTDAAVTLLQKFDPSGLTELRTAPGSKLNLVVEQLGRFPRALEALAGMLLEDPILRLDDLLKNLASTQNEISDVVVQQALARLEVNSMRVLQALAIYNQPVSFDALSFLVSPFIGEATLRQVVRRLLHACFVKSNRDVQQFGLHPIDQAYCYDGIPRGSLTDMVKHPLPFTRCALHLRAAEYFRSQARPAIHWKQVTDLQPQLNEFEHRVAAGDFEEAARVLLSVDQNYLWEWGQRKLLKRLYTRIKGKIIDARLRQQVNRRSTWLKFHEIAEEADREFEAQLELARANGDDLGAADALDDLAQTYRRNGRDLQRALELHQEALNIYRRLGNLRGEADALGGMAAVRNALMDRDPEETINMLEVAIKIQRELGNINSLSFLLTQLGNVYQDLGLYQKSLETIQESVRLAEENHSTEALIRAMLRLVYVYGDLGEDAKALSYAREAARRALEISGDQVTPLSIIAQTFLGATLGNSGDLPNGIKVLKETIQAANNQPMTSMSRFFLGQILLRSKEFQQARSLLAPSLIDPHNHFMFNSAWVGVLLARVGETENALTFFREAIEITRYLQHNIPVAYFRALAYAGLAVLQNDADFANKAGAAYQEIYAHANSILKTRQHIALINLLLETPGGEILTPVRTILAMSATH